MGWAVFAITTDQSGRRHQRSLAVWASTVVAAATAFTLGVYGYAQCYATRSGPSTHPSFVDLLYYSLGCSLLSVKRSRATRFRHRSKSLRWLAPLSLSAAAIKTLLNFAREQVQVVRRRRYTPVRRMRLEEPPNDCRLGGATEDEKEKDRDTATSSCLSEMKSRPRREKA